MPSHAFGPASRKPLRTNVRGSIGSTIPILSRTQDKSIPPTGWQPPENGPMPKLKELQGVLAQNVERLRTEFAPEGQRTMNKFAKWCGIGNSALQALKDGTGDPQLSTLTKLAGRFGMDVWQLFIPGADPRHKPRLVTPDEIAWYLRLEQLREELKRGGESPSNHEPIPFVPTRAGRVGNVAKSAAHRFRTKKKE